MAAALLVGFDSAEGAEDLVVAVEKATMVKGLGLIGLGILGEIWRNQRALFKKHEDLRVQVATLKGICEGKNGTCATEDEE